MYILKDIDMFYASVVQDFTMYKDCILYLLYIFSLLFNKIP